MNAGDAQFQVRLPASLTLASIIRNGPGYHALRPEPATSKAKRRLPFPALSLDQGWGLTFPGTPMGSLLPTLLAHSGFVTLTRMLFILFPRTLCQISE